MAPVSRAGARGSEDGAVAVLVAICALALFVVAALVVDLGLARDTRRQSQNAADAAALAAVNVLYPTSGTCADGTTTPATGCKVDAAAAAKEYAESNFDLDSADWARCALPPSGFASVSSYPTCISIDPDGKHVWVALPTRHVKTGLGNAAGISDVPVGSAARATVMSGVPASCGLCFLGPIDAGNADFTVEGGSIAINGDMEGGPNGNWTATGGTIGIVGDWDGANPSPMWSQTEPFTDPWATATNVPPAVAGTVKANPACSTSGRRGVAGNGPGRYGSFSIPNEPCTLSPGLYVITGAWTMSNNTNLVGTGVTLYFTCGTPAAPHVCGDNEAGGHLDAKNGALHLAAPTTGANTGLAIVYDRKNTQNLGLQGNGDTAITGAVYAPNAMLDFNGNSCFGFDQGPVIAKGVIMANGNHSCVIVHNSTDVDVDNGPPEIALDR